MTDLDKRARRARHRAILAVAPDRPLVEPWIGWARAALAWERGQGRKRAGRYVPVPAAEAYRPPPRLVGLTGRPLRAAIARAVRERETHAENMQRSYVAALACLLSWLNVDSSMGGAP